MTSTVHQLRAAANFRNQVVALSRRLRQSSRTDSATWTGLMVMGVIDRHKDEATPTIIADELRLRSSNVAAVLRDLQERGLILRATNPSDKRKVRLSVSEAGNAFLVSTRAVRDKWLVTAMAECLSDEEQARLFEAGDLMAHVAAWHRDTT